MANYDVLKVDGTKSGSVELNDAVFAIEPNNSVLLKQLIYNVLHYDKVHTLLRTVQQYEAAELNHGDKKVQDVRVKVQSVLHNGVVVVSYSDQHQEATHTKCLRKCVV